MTSMSLYFFKENAKCVVFVDNSVCRWQCLSMTVFVCYPYEIGVSASKVDDC